MQLSTGLSDSEIIIFSDRVRVDLVTDTVLTFILIRPGLSQYRGVILSLTVRLDYCHSAKTYFLWALPDLFLKQSIWSLGRIVDCYVGISTESLLLLPGYSDSEIVTFSDEVSVDLVTVTVSTDLDDSVLKWGIIMKTYIISGVRSASVKTSAVSSMAVLVSTLTVTVKTLRRFHQTCSEK